MAVVVTLGSVDIVAAGLLGLCFGSFANVVTHRIPLGQSCISPPSHCPKCGTRLKWRAMIPIISWLVLRGRSLCCNSPISKRYPVTEACCSILFILMAKNTGLTLFVLPLWGLAFVLLCISIIDWYTMEIPDGLLIVGVLFVVAWLVLTLSTASAASTVPPPVSTVHTWQDAILGAIAGAMPLFVLDRIIWLTAKKPGFGLGDIKLMVMCGLFLGWQGIPAVYFIAFITGGIYGTILLLTGKAKKGSYLPFGPFLCGGTLISFLAL